MLLNAIQRQSGPWPSLPSGDFTSENDAVCFLDAIYDKYSIKEPLLHFILFRIVREIAWWKFYDATIDGSLDIDRGAATKFWLGWGRILVRQTHLPPNSDLSSDFGHFVLNILKSLNIIGKFLKKDP